MSSFWERIRNPKCTACPLHTQTKRVCSVSGRGNINASVMFVGEAPGQSEEIRGIPFVGPAGKLLTETLFEIGWDRPYTITNAVWCRPRDNSTPKTSEWRTCSSLHLEKVIAKQRPSMIICLGLIALKAVTGEAGLSIKKARGKVYEIERTLEGKGRRKQITRRRMKIKVMTTYHPAAILRDPTKKAIFQADLERILARLTGKVIDEDPEDRIYVYQSEGEDLGWRLSAGHSMAVDLETSCLSPFDEGARILAVGVSQAAMHGFAFPITHDQARKRLRDALLNPKITKVGHNFKFDLLWLRKNGFEVKGPIFDTMVAMHLIDENYPDKTLEHLAATFTSMGDYADGIKDNRLKPGYLESLDKDTLYHYVCGDADATYRLSRLFVHRLRQERLRPTMRLSMHALRALTEVELSGAYVDGERLDLAIEDYARHADKIRRWLRRRYGKLLNWNSPAQVAELVFQRFGIRTRRFTKTGRPRADEESLTVALSRTDCPVQQKTIRGILELRRLIKVKNTYLMPLRENHLKANGLVHPTYNITGTRTGRTSCKEPNWQNIPPSIKSVFRSRWVYGSIVVADFSQMELRVLAELSDEPMLKEAFEQGRDIHTETAALVFSKPSRKITEQERYLAKTVNFAIIYGAEAPKIKQLTGLELHEAERLVQDYRAALPQVTRWINSVKRQCLRTGEVLSPIGRKRRLPIDDPTSKQGQEMLREAVNAPIQGTASDLTLMALIKLNTCLQAGMKSCIIGTVHDSIILDCPAPEVDEVMMMVDEICSRIDATPYGFEMTVPLKIDISFGPSWGEQKGLQ